MKSNILQAIRLTLICILFFSGVYTLAVWGMALAIAPNSGKGETVQANGRTVGYALIGQSFTNDNYFNGRPSVVSYNAAGSGGSNKGPSNPDYLQTVEARIDTFLAHNPGIDKSEIPGDLIAASGSGLDPHISVQAAKVQVKRIAKARGIAEEKIQQLVLANTEKPWLGLFGPKRINVLKLNMALDTLL